MHKFAPTFVCKIQEKVNKYIHDRYSHVEKIHYNNKIQYLDLLDNSLADEKDWHNCCFMLPNGKLKKLDFDLSDFDFSFIDNNVLLSHIKIEHKNIIYKGFDLDDIIKAGCIRIGYVEWQSELYIHFNSNKNIPNKLFDILEYALYQVKDIYIDINHPCKSFHFSNSNGDTIIDIKQQITK